MEKDTRLVNIYIKIHNKHTLTVEDLKYLAKYDPECFEKTCKNLVYRLPETREILQPEKEEQQQVPEPVPVCCCQRGYGMFSVFFHGSSCL